MVHCICTECGKEIDDGTKTCPHCGYPIAENRKNIFKWIIFIGVIIIIALASLLFISINSMKDYNSTISQRGLDVNNANAFIETLPASCKVMAIIIDSTTQKVYYFDTEKEKYPSVFRYNISTRENSIIMNWDTEIDGHLILMHTITDYKYVEVNKRLFVISENAERDKTSNANVVFIDVKDDRVYLVANGEQAFFTSSSIIKINKPELEYEISVYDEIEEMKKANDKEHPYWYYYGE